MNLTLSAELDRAASEAPTKTFIRTRDEELSYAQCLARVQVRALRLRSFGIEPGDAVALLMDNSADQVVTWLALNRLGAVHAPLNTALSGARLAHALSVVEPVVVIADEPYADTARTLIEDQRFDTCVLDPADLTSAHCTTGIASAVSSVPADRGDLETATLLFTSGTTGAPKACALSNRYLVRQGELHAKYIEISSDDVLYCPFPLFHIDAATLTVSAALAARATAALGRRFSASGFWQEVRRFEATIFNFMGATLTILWKRDTSGHDRKHRVRLAWGAPMPDWQNDFESRFAIPLRQVYGLTDGGVPVYDPLREGQRRGRAGRVIEEYELRIDTNQRRQGDAADVGEILVRGREPGLVMNGYFRDPSATAQTIVDGWVRTGDLGSLDRAGFLTFHGRLSDSIRRRGENISAFDVEELVASHPGVLEATALGVPSELTEEDVMVCVVAREGAHLEPDQLHQHCREHGPSYMAPRYIRFVDELPKTPTQKVEKFRLRDEGITADTWDSERRT